MNILTFDIETIPDIKSARKIYDLDPAWNDQEAAEHLFKERKEATGSEFLPLHLHRVAAISAVLHTPSTFNVWSLGNIDSDEKEIIERFYHGIDKYTPTLVSWNGSSFDLPVLHYRSLLHGIVAERYWELGDHDNQFKWNNYINRYHYRHTDLMDVLAAYQPRANAKLDEIAVMLGLPGKMGMSGAKVWESFQVGKIDEIRNYCETDVLNTHLVYLRFLMIQGQISTQEYAKYCADIKEHLANSSQKHLFKFLSFWNQSST